MSSQVEFDRHYKGVWVPWKWYRRLWRETPECLNVTGYYENITGTVQQVICSAPDGQTYYLTVLNHSIPCWKRISKEAFANESS